MSIQINEFSQLLLQWYDQNGRQDLPWRTNISPYRVWLSEIMLQQTQVTTVVPYFQRFINKFSSINDLANATEDEVLHLWTGLGYYSRARNLYKTAKIIQSSYNGLFPDSVTELIKLPGIGRSTAGAIIAIAYQRTAPILDGNVKRVLTRIHAITGWPGENSVTKKLWETSEQYTPKIRAGDYTQAIMDLGATICTRTNPKCAQCPLQKYCVAHAKQMQTHFPTPKMKKTIPTKEVKMLVIGNAEHSIFLVKRPPTGIWGGLWSLPECDPATNINEWCKENYGFITELQETMSPFRHTFSHFHLIITPIKLSVLDYSQQIRNSEPNVWINPSQQYNIGLSAPVKKILQSLGGNYT